MPRLGDLLLKGLRQHVRNHFLRRRREVPVRVVTVSDVMREHGLRCGSGWCVGGGILLAWLVSSATALSFLHARTRAPTRHHTTITHHPTIQPHLHPTHSRSAYTHSRVDLLKVDAECADLMVLRGVEAKDWRRVAAVAMEVHAEELLEPVLALLRGAAGFKRVEWRAGDASLGDGVYSVWATR